METLAAARILILGLGESGLAMARWCAHEGAQVTVADSRPAPPQHAALQASAPGAREITGALDATLLGRGPFDAIYRSPGLTPAQLAPLTAAAAGRGIFVGGEIDLFVQALAHLEAERGYAPTLIAVTGTNGKTTVTDLAGHLVASADKSVAVAGNISPSLLEALRAHLDAGTLPDVWVLELSSFQLEAMHAFEPDAATVLNLTQDHLDWHGSMDAYVAAKARIFGAHAALVLNRDDARVLALRPAAAAPLRGRRATPARPVVTFGADVPQVAGDFGLEVVNGMTWLVRAAASGPLQRLMPADALRIHGRHNALNALAALALATSCGLPLAPMLYGLREYRGLPHRLESLGVIDGVEYFDDGKGTNVGATVAALAGLGHDRRLVVILGGDGKGQDFSPLAAPVREFARAVVLIGRDAPLIRAVLEPTGTPLIEAATLADAVERARAAAVPGDAVVLSPACASFDMFRNYVHRSQVFCDLVRALAHARGVVLEMPA